MKMAAIAMQVSQVSCARYYSRRAAYSLTQRIVTGFICSKDALT
jgi:hypothetical protein